MAQVSIRVNGREYDLACGDGEEAHLRNLAQYIDTKITALRGGGANLNDAQLLLMAGIVIADELSEATQAGGKLGSDTHSGPELMAAFLDSAASRLEALTARLEPA